jgi:HNH endonuclease
MSRRRRAHLHIHPLAWLAVGAIGLFWPELLFHDSSHVHFLENAWMIALGATVCFLAVSRGRRHLRWRLLRRRGQLWRRQVAAGAPGERNSREIPAEVRSYVWRRDGGRCVQCGSTKNLEYDHKLPWSRGGSNTVRNIQLLCHDCNIKKGASWPADYVG